MRDLEMAIRVVGEDDACVGVIPMWHHGAQVDPAFSDADIIGLVWFGGGGRVDACHTYLTPHNAEKVRCRLSPDGSREYRFTIRQPIIAESMRGTFSTKENFRLLLY